MAKAYKDRLVPTQQAIHLKRRRRPHRNHVELRSYDPVPPMQCVAEINEQKSDVRLREINKMTALLAERFKSTLDRDP